LVSAVVLAVPSVVSVVHSFSVSISKLPLVVQVFSKGLSYANFAFVPISTRDDDENSWVWVTE
jgi:thiamine transporter ThiT